MRTKYQICSVLVGMCCAVSAHAEMFWSSFSLSYLKGDNYEVVGESADVLTVEHASGHSWGDNFFFVDHLTIDGGSGFNNYYELSPRLSLSYLTKNKLSLGPVSDFYIATTWEGSTFNNYLVGLGTSIKVPGFKYFTVNLYQAYNDLWDDDEQLTLTWGLPFGSGNAEFLYDGFLDWSSASDTNKAELNFTSQLKWNAGKVMGLKSPLYVGIEYAYWVNKFGIPGIDEKNPCLLIKWHF